MPVPYELLGRLFVYLAVLVFLVTTLALLIGAYSFRRHRILFPNFVLFMLYLFKMDMQGFLYQRSAC